MPALERLSKLLNTALLSVARGRVWRRQRNRLARAVFISLRGTADQLIEAAGIERLVLQQLLSNLLELLFVLREDFLGLRVSLVENPFDLVVNFLGRAFAAIPLQCAVHTR